MDTSALSRGKIIVFRSKMSKRWILTFVRWSQHQAQADERPLQHHYLCLPGGHNTQPSLYHELPLQHHHLASVEVSLPFSSQKPFVPMGLGANSASLPEWAAGYPPQGTKGASISDRRTLSAGGAQGRRRGAGYFGGGASTWADLVDLVDCFVFICVSSW